MLPGFPERYLAFRIATLAISQPPRIRLGLIGADSGRMASGAAI
jgi:hypothetical protein